MPDAGVAPLEPSPLHAGSLIVSLAELHVNYEQQSEYPLERVEKGQLNWRVEKMRLGKDTGAPIATFVT